MTTPGVYKHYKGGLYRVLHLAKHSETLEAYVVYEHLDDNSVWVRPQAMFEESVLVHGTPMPRFERIK